jgi:hypothetical protein
MVNAISEENAVRAANEARRFRQARSRAYPPLARMIPTSRPFTRRARKLRSAGRRCSLRGDRRGDGRAGFASRRRAALDADRNHGQRACQRAGSQIRGGDRCRIGGGEARRPAGRDSGRAAPRSRARGRRPETRGAWYSFRSSGVSWTACRRRSRRRHSFPDNTGASGLRYPLKRRSTLRAPCMPPSPRRRRTASGEAPCFRAEC